MPNISDRPYVGTWRNNMRQVVRHTPDGLVFINGDMGIPGCERCRGRIDIQRFVTGISVDASTQPGGLSATITMSVPRISGDQLFRDGYNKLFPGLEVHIYMRGYFPTTGYFGATPQESTPKISLREGEDIEWGKVPAYPYYPVFHGVVTNVSYEYSGGEYHASMSCASLLHFWQYQNINSEGAQIGQKPDNSQIKSGTTGTNYNNTHPFAMIYNLYKSNAGAAGGVAHALSGTSNLDAPADSIRKGREGSAPYTQVTEYWSQRFRSRIQNLRMYGVNGNLFNAAQQAFLGQRGKDDFQNLLKQVQFAEDGTLSNVKDPFSRDIAVAKALGFERSGFDFIWSPRDRPDRATGDDRGVNKKDDYPASLNLLDMYAYTHQETDNGQVQLFESTYETKLQIAETVTEVTGYEFYQDVDGDLVFKPPFYNLDTKPNRIYRIEDIDIISINFTHSEPTATWMRVKTTYTKGASGYVSNGDETNREAKYADWALVAQFGWRPATMEVTYTSDTRAAFLIGVARLDLLNIGVNSATLTIPLRPELRPGIPVYIAFEDTYYYISQLAHGLNFGSQCSTTLQLTCRRRKFFPPGEPGPAADGQDINDLILLNRVDKPPRPIQIHGDDGPRLAGFPNVVLALDPTRLNPKFLAVGAGLPHLNSTEDTRLFFNFIREDLKGDGVFQEVSSSEAADPNQPVSESTQYKMQVSEGEFLIFSIGDLHAAYNDLQNARKKVDRITKEIATKRNELWAESQIASGHGVRGPSTTKNVGLAAATERLLEAKGALNIVETGGGGGTLVNGQGEVIESEGVPNANLFQAVIETTRLARGKPMRRSIDGIPGSDELAGQIDMLENLKVSYNALQLPGHYRYYSVSHPNPVMQGQPAIFLHDRKRKKKAVPAASTGGGAKPAAIPPPTSVPQTAPVNTDGLTPEQALVARLKGAGVKWVKQRELTWYRDDSGGDSRERLSPGKTAAEIKATPLTEENITNLVNIAAAGQLLQENLLNNQLWKDALAINPKFHLQHTSSWRPFGKVEGKGKQSQHAIGKAIDCLPSDGSTYKPQKLAGFSPAYSALVQEAQKLYNQGVIGGLGLYASAGFVHIDVRDSPGRWAQWIPAGGDKDDAFYAKCKVSGSFQDTVLTPVYPRDAAEDVNGQSVCSWWQKILRENDYPGYAAIQRVRGNRPNVGELDPNANAPEVGQPPPPPPVEPPPPPPPPPPEAIDGPPITLIEIDLETPVKVRGFVPPTVEDPQLRPPEADYGMITATKGMIIARGPAGTPQIVSTDKIQTMRWSQFRATKDTSITGDTPNGGDYNFLRKAFKKNLSERFYNAAQDTDPTGDSTAADMFQELWDLIQEQLSEGAPGGPLARRSVYKFDPDNPGSFTEVYLGPLMSDFEEAGSSGITSTESSEEAARQKIQDGLDFLGVTQDDILLEFSEVGNFQFVAGAGNGPPEPTEFTITVDVSIANSPLKKTKSFPQFTAASSVTKQGKKGQVFNSTLRKMADAYAEAIVGVFEGNFNALQRDAMEPSTGRPDRVSQLSAQFDAAANTALNTDNFKSTEKGRRTIKVEKFGKIGSPIHSPIRPISDAEGYEHFGSYRYGRGLSIEEGGTFAWIHNNDDPFGRLSAQAGEELLTALTLIKGGKGQASQDAQKAATAGLIAQVEKIREEEAVQQAQSAINALPSEQREEAQRRLDSELQSRAELRLALNFLLGTFGNSTVDELLSTNVVADGSVEVINVDRGIYATQLEMKFANFAASYTNSGPFKSSVSNAAYRLVDLTNHLQHPDMQACSCKGSVSDVALAAFGRNQFAPVDGIDGERSPAEAFVAEQILTSSVDYFYQQKALRGEVLNPNQTPDAGLFDKLKSQIGTSLSGVRNGFVSTGNQFSEVPEQFRNLSDDFREAFGG